MSDYRNFKSTEFGNHKNGRISAGIILIAVGAIFLLRNTGFFIPHWLFSWPVLLIVIGIYSGFKHNFKNCTSFILIGIGGFYLLFLNFGFGGEQVFWPILIIAVGLIYIFKPKRRHYFHNKYWQSSNTQNPTETDMNQTAKTTTGDFTESTAKSDTNPNDFIVTKSIFSGINTNVISKDFKGGYISAIFGGSEIDLTQADIKDTAMIKFEIVFGGIKMIIPSHWTVHNEIEGMFHGIDDRRKYNPSVVVDPNKILILKGSVVFGGIDIRSY